MHCSFSEDGRTRVIDFVADGKGSREWRVVVEGKEMAANGE